MARGATYDRLSSYATFRDRPVRDFIPILVERRARRILVRSSG
ncbi:three-helix bundle dimerization domain-containing protein [Streptomyces sp. NPDC003233]